MFENRGTRIAIHLLVSSVPRPRVIDNFHDSWLCSI